MPARSLTFEEALSRMTAFCSTSEHCESEVRERLRKAVVAPSDADRIVDFLYAERYLDSARFCRAFASDRLRFAHWGRLKIQQALRLKGLPEADIREALEALPREAYSEVLGSLLRQKQRSLPDEDDYVLRGKLIRFLASHGFTMDEILDAL